MCHCVHAGQAVWKGALLNHALQPVGSALGLEVLGQWVDTAEPCPLVPSCKDTFHQVCVESVWWIQTSSDPTFLKLMDQMENHTSHGRSLPSLFSADVLWGKDLSACRAGHADAGRENLPDGCLL